MNYVYLKNKNTSRVWSIFLNLITFDWYDFKNMQSKLKSAFMR